jgi:hypothetical protein
VRRFNLLTFRNFSKHDGREDGPIFTAVFTPSSAVIIDHEDPLTKKQHFVGTRSPHTELPQGSCYMVD